MKEPCFFIQSVIACYKWLRCLLTFYRVVFGPQEVGWNAAGSFDGSAIAFGAIILFDN